MKCQKCGAENANEKNFCSDCGFLLNPQLLPIVRSQVEEYCRERFKDQTVVDIKTTEAIAERFLKWGRWFLFPATFLIAVLTLILAVLGIHEYSDVHEAAKQAITGVNAAGQQAEAKVSQAVQSIETSVRQSLQTAGEVNGQFKQLSKEADTYRQVISRINELQKELKDAKGNWNKLDLTVRTLHTAPGPPGEPSFVALGAPVCPSPSLIAGYTAAYCVKGPPYSLFQVTPSGETRPVSGSSPSGFQDLSVAPKPNCDASRRGTFYVEKETGNAADKPFLCERESGGSFVWVAFTLAQ